MKNNLSLPTAHRIFHSSLDSFSLGDSSRLDYHDRRGNQNQNRPSRPD